MNSTSDMERDAAPGLPGIGPAVMVETRLGPQPAEWLRPGDLLLTRDHGYRPLLWTGRSATTGPGVVPPLHIPAGSLGTGVPEHDLTLSPGHHLLLRGPQVALHFGEEEVLAPARDIATGAGPAADMPLPPGHALCHLLTAEHELLLAEGIWLESLLPDPAALDRFGPAAAAEIAAALGPALATGQCARMVLRPGEAGVLHPRTAVATRRRAA
ncbi:Hint domain-containing protein [Celeribacter indicus]|nr:Hint domain-containing protein [Celeribacter indicus]SDW88027.1 Hint domain-containing protein [Celeribacter indicus]